MKYPPQLYTVEVYFGPEVEPFFRSYSDPAKAGQDLRVLKAKMLGSNASISALRMWHNNKLMSQYIATPPRPRWIHVPAPDADGITRIPPRTRGQMLMERPKAPKVAKGKGPVIIGPLPTISPDHKFEL